MNLPVRTFLLWLTGVMLWAGYKTNSFIHGHMQYYRSVTGNVSNVKLPLVSVLRKTKTRPPAFNRQQPGRGRGIYFGRCAFGRIIENRAAQTVLCLRFNLR
jgi:hypothetical protein